MTANHRTSGGARFTAGNLIARDFGMPLTQDPGFGSDLIADLLPSCGRERVRAGAAIMLEGIEVMGGFCRANNPSPMFADAASVVGVVT